MFSSETLASAAVSEIAFRIRCSIDQINEVIPTISNFNIGGPFTAFWVFAKADLHGDLSVCHSRVISV